jgi:hypothetical protein
LELEEISTEPDDGVPRCVAGRRACPPEDVGGVGGYESFLRAIRNRRDENHKTYLEWVGGSFDPEAFDMEAINEVLASEFPGHA